jgi:NhaP-type Na+/H+ or K+/H+ antiporter
MSLETNSSSSNNDQGESESSTVILFLSFSVLAACISKIIFSKILRNKVPLPFTVAVLMLGFIIGIIVTQVKNINNDFLYGEIQLSGIDPHLLYYIFLPLLIFDSSFNGHFHVIKQQLLSAIILAGPGVFITTAIIAICGIYIFPYDWSWLVGLTFGSILSATDPIAVVALLHDSGASKSLASLIDSESLLNDGSAFVMFLIFHNIVIGGNHSAKNIIISIVKYSIGKSSNSLINLVKYDHSIVSEKHENCQNQSQTVSVKKNFFPAKI